MPAIIAFALITYEYNIIGRLACKYKKYDLAEENHEKQTNYFISIC